MDSGAAAFFVVFGAAAIAFGLWLRPKWQRARRHRLLRKDGLLFSPARGREWWLWINTWGSIALGAILITVVAADAVGGYFERVREAEERARQEELHRYVARCTRQSVILHNPGPDSRRIKLAKLALVESQVALMGREDRWKATLRDPGEVVLAPGQTATLRYESTPGVCDRIVSAFSLTAPYECNLEFDVDIGNLNDRIACRIK